MSRLSPHKINKILVASIIFLSISFHTRAEYIPAYSIQKASETISVNEDATQQQIIELLIQIDTNSGVENEGQQVISYNSDREKIQILEAYTLQPDGKKIIVSKDAIRDSSDSLSTGAPMFSSTKHKIVIFPKVKLGSRLYYKYRYIEFSPQFKRNFIYSTFFYPHLKIKDYKINLDLPKKLAIQVESKNIEGGLVKESKNRKYYSFSFNQVEAYPIENWEVDPRDFSPYLLASSFKSQKELGLFYEKLASPKIKVTSDIMLLANKLTQGLNDEQSQVTALYNWVSKNIRYVSVHLENGGIIPHSSDVVLQNHYGDCKDHAVIFAALLKAKGIKSSFALINLGESYKLPNLAVIKPQNHVITYIPSLDIYLDSTSQFSPYGTLPFEDMDKPVILTTLGEIGHTPIPFAKDNVIKSNIEISINNDGTMAGNAESTVTGYHNDDVRSRESNSQGIEDQDRVDSRLKRNGETGTGRISATDPLDLSTPFIEKTSFVLDAKSNFPGPGAMTVPVGVKLNNLTSLVSEKPRPKATFPIICFSKTLQENYTLLFPETTKIKKIPNNVDYKNSKIHYHAHYSQNGNNINISRTFESEHNGSVCDADFNDLIKEAFSVIQRDLRSQIFYY